MRVFTKEGKYMWLLSDAVTALGHLEISALNDDFTQQMMRKGIEVRPGNADSREEV
jgi:hypothetical protein